MKNSLRRSQRPVKLGCFFLLQFLILGRFSIEKKTTKDMTSSFLSEPKGYLIPYISGQGLNNQLWEYRSAAIIAKASNRRLCLEPFHRFYLQERGRKFISFVDLFDEESLKTFVQLASRKECAHECNQTIHRRVELITKETSKHGKERHIADWRPGSLALFYKSTGFRYLPLTNFININDKDGGVRFNSLEDIREVLADYASDNCISILGTTPILSREFLDWSRVLNVNQNIKNVVNEIKSEMFSNKSFISIHWRFEESKCAGYGRGIGFGRSIGTHHSRRIAPNDKKKIKVRKSDIEADLCFFAGPMPSMLEDTGIWLRLVSKRAVVSWIERLKRERNIENIYIATDCSDEALLQWIKHKTGAITKSDIMPILSRFVSTEENDIISRIEQQICTDSSVFFGTSMSSWTSSVVEERFKDRDSFFVQDKYSFTRRPDPMNRTLYFDIEVCNCEWKSQG